MQQGWRGRETGKEGRKQGEVGTRYKVGMREGTRNLRNVIRIEEMSEKKVIVCMRNLRKD